MSTLIRMPTSGRVVRVRRRPGHFAREGDPVVDLEVGENFLLTVCSPFDGKIMRCRAVDEVVRAGDGVIEVTGVGKETWELFIAYRRADAPGHAGRVGANLIGHFGPGQVFKDIEALPAGVDFPDFIREKLQRAFTMVVIIGPRWATNPRLHNPDDLHREEIATAFARDIHVVPVLVDGASMPRAEQLPEQIRRLVRRQAVEITDTRWDYDVGQLLEHLDEVLTNSPSRLRFLAQVSPEWPEGQKWQWVVDSPTEKDLE